MANALHPNWASTKQRLASPSKPRAKMKSSRAYCDGHSAVDANLVVAVKPSERLAPFYVMSRIGRVNLYRRL